MFGQPCTYPAAVLLLVAHAVIHPRVGVKVISLAAVDKLTKQRLCKCISWK